jgi:hypothetical protein
MTYTIAIVDMTDMPVRQELLTLMPAPLPAEREALLVRTQLLLLFSFKYTCLVPELFQTLFKYE